jgi:hypothetical protein
MEQYDIIFSQNFVRGHFECELGVLCICTMVEIKIVLAPLLAFTSIYDATKVCNMLALILDLSFKSLDVLKKIIEKAIVIQMVVKYNNNNLMPLLVIFFQFLNLDIHGGIEPSNK